MGRRMILDTDMGSDVDDALCLALALASPEIELVAVTHVSRESKQRARITRRLLDLAGRPDIPVFAGCAEPMTGEPLFVWFGNEGVGILDDDAKRDDPSFDGSSLRVEEEPAVDAMARMLRREPGLEIVAVGPLTNLAALIERDSVAASKIGKLTIMGGHIREVAYGGAVFRHGVDYNLCSDRDASMRVLRAGIPTRLVTADVTLQTWIRERDLVAIEQCNTALHRALGRAIRAWTPIMRAIFSGHGAQMEGDNAAFLHDPLALACAFDESFCSFADLAIEPAIVDGVFRTIERGAANEAGDHAFPMRCALEVDGDRFRSFFVERVLALCA